MLTIFKLCKEVSGCSDSNVIWFYVSLFTDATMNQVTNTLAGRSSTLTSLVQVIMTVH